MRPDNKQPLARRQNGADPYVWLEQREAPEVTTYLNAENAYTDAWLEPHKALEQSLFEEIRGRIRETDLGLPSPKGNWLYYQRTEAGAEYPRFYRCERSVADSLEIHKPSEQLILDLNSLASGEEFLQLGDFSISPDQRWLAYSLDTQGDETYRLFLLSLDDMQTQELSLDDADGSLCWAQDNKTLFAVSMDETSRPSTLWRLQPGTEPAQVFHDPDQRFYVSAYLSSSERYICVSSNSKNTSEIHYLPADKPTAQLRCLASREADHEYDADHGSDGFMIRSNRLGEMFCLYSCDAGKPGLENWELVTPPDPQRTLEEISLQSTALVLQYRHLGLTQLEVRVTGSDSYTLAMPDAVYSLSVQGGEEYSSPQIRLRYESLNRPAEVRALTLATGEQHVLKQTPVEGIFDPDDYLIERLWAKAKDGTHIPISLICHKDTQGEAPLYLYGYGSYGASMDPWFSHARLSLLHRGWVFAIAHVRGGADMGEHWYQQGKLQHKENTFSDFIACAEHLISTNKTSPQHLVIAGGSAGGLLIGNVINQRPELFAAAVADVPFVDVWNTMNNPDLPLTVGEYEEWGDAREPEVAARIKGYAPYENVTTQDYPALWVTAGFHDVRVQYWEAAKWVAKLRHLRTNDQPLLLRTQMTAGHGGASGRYQAMREVAEEYCFLLTVIT